MYSFCGRQIRLGHRAFALKSGACPHCDRTGTLNRHSRLYGNDYASAQRDARRLRGQRVHCSACGTRGGCGRTFPIYLADVLPRHSVPGALLTLLLVGLLAGTSVHAAAAAQPLLGPFSLLTFYRLAARLGRQNDHLRVLLSGVSTPPPCAHADPLRETIAHLRAVFAAAADLVAAFQLRFQVPLLL
ncbi:MAG: hypothetical protein H7067_11330 [Burkholderiales bacterium]|nr:hypothetical protein [Opitutaceae bacterium]